MNRRQANSGLADLAQRDPAVGRRSGRVGTLLQFVSCDTSTAGISPRFISRDLTAPLLPVKTACLFAFFSRRLLFPHQKRALTLTEINTLLNRHENGGTGVAFRKFRKLFLPPPVFGDEAELADSDQEGETGTKNGTKQLGAVERVEQWKYRSRPQPAGLRSCLKRIESSLSDGSSTPASTAEQTDRTDEAVTSLPLSLPRHVRIIEPELDELELLREVWSTPEMHAVTGHRGIGGFRRTRDFYSKSQGGSAVVKRPAGTAAKDAAPVAVPAKTETEKDTPSEQKEGDDQVGNVEPIPSLGARSSPRSLGSLNTLSPASSRQKSPSPVSANRRPHRTLSPSTSANGARSSSPAFVVGSQSKAAKGSPARRRAPSPIMVTAGPNRSASPAPLSPRSASAGADTGTSGPGWLRNKSGNAVTPAPAKGSSAAASGDSTSEHETTDESADEEDGIALDEQHRSDGPQTDLTSPEGFKSPHPADVLPRAVPVELVGDSPASVLSGGESPQDSPTPAVAKRAPPPPAALQPSPSISVTPSSPPHSRKSLPQLGDASPSSPTSPSPLKASFSAEDKPSGTTSPASASEVSPAASDAAQTTAASTAPSSAPSAASTASTASTTSPSPCAAAQDRRLSLRVQQTMRDKQKKRHSHSVHHDATAAAAATPVSLSA